MKAIGRTAPIVAPTMGRPTKPEAEPRPRRPPEIAPRMASERGVKVRATCGQDSPQNSIRPAPKMAPAVTEAKVRIRRASRCRTRMACPLGQVRLPTPDSRRPIAPTAVYSSDNTPSSGEDGDL